MAYQEMLGMVPQPVLAVLMCYPITAETEAEAKRGGEWRDRGRDEEETHELLLPSMMFVLSDILKE